jgi:hypothetical protein
VIEHRTKREPVTSGDNSGRLHRIRSAARYRELIQIPDLDDAQRNELANLALYLGHSTEKVSADRAAAMHQEGR